MAVLILKHPLQFGKVSITKLTIRDYTTAGDYLAFDQRGGVAQRIALVASMSGQDEEVIKQLRGPDYLEAVKIVDALFDADESTNQMPKGDEKKLPES